MQSYGNLGLCDSFLGKKQAGLAAFDKALELDPGYQPANTNRMILQSLKEGEKMADFQHEVVEYYKDGLPEHCRNDSESPPSPADVSSSGSPTD